MPLEVAQLLFLLVRLKAPHYVLELGTGLGYSALLLAAAAPDAAIHSVECEAERVQMARCHVSQAAFQTRVAITHASALDALDQLAQSYDFVLLDAAKEDYPRYFSQVQPHLAAEALVVADDVLLDQSDLLATFDAATRAQIVAGLTAYRVMLHQDDRFVTLVLPVACGIAISQTRGLDTMARAVVPSGAKSRAPARTASARWQSDYSLHRR